MRIVLSDHPIPDPRLLENEFRRELAGLPSREFRSTRIHRIDVSRFCSAGGACAGRESERASKKKSDLV